MQNVRHNGLAARAYVLYTSQKSKNGIRIFFWREVMFQNSIGIDDTFYASYSVMRTLQQRSHHRPNDPFPVICSLFTFDPYSSILSLFAENLSHFSFPEFFPSHIVVVVVLLLPPPLPPLHIVQLARELSSAFYPAINCNWHFSSLYYSFFYTLKFVLSSDIDLICLKYLLTVELQRKISCRNCNWPFFLQKYISIFLK